MSWSDFIKKERFPVDYKFCTHQKKLIVDKKYVMQILNNSNTIYNVVIDILCEHNQNMFQEHNSYIFYHKLIKSHSKIFVNILLKINWTFGIVIFID